MPRDYDDEDDRPKKRRRPVDDEEDRPRKKRARDDDDERPRARRQSQAEDDFDDRHRTRRRKRREELNVVGLISLIVGIGGVLFSFIPCIGLYAFIPGLLGVALGLIGWVVARNSDGRYGPKLAVIGLSVSFVAILFGLSWIFIAKYWEKKLDKGWKQAEAEMAREEAALKKERAKAPSEVAAAAQGGAIQVTAHQFARDYEDNEETADFKYKNKVLEVTGVVEELDFTGDTYTVHLKAGRRGSVDCQFAKDPDVRARLAQLQPGTQVTIRGKCLGGSATIEACVLVQAP